MRQATTKALYSLHAWTGIVIGVLLFVVCLSGAVVVFKHEIDLWANPSLRELPRTDARLALDSVAAAVRKYDAAFDPQSIALPDALAPAYIVFGEDGAGVRQKLAVRADTGKVLGPVESELGQFVRTLHVFLFFGPRWIVGFLGVVMLASIVSGVLIHQKILKNLFTQRWQSSLRLMLSDAHKVIGVWALLFHILIAFTGAWLGLAPVFVSAAKYLAGVEPESRLAAPSAPASMRSLDALRPGAHAALPGLTLRHVFLQDWGQSDAQVTFAGPMKDYGGYQATATYRGADGGLVELHDPRSAGFWSRVDGWMEPLHFGDFGGSLLKWLYFFLGLTPALLSITGTWLWIERHRRETAGDP